MLTLGLSYPSWPVAFQFKHIHGIVDPPTIVVKLNVPGQPLNVHLHSCRKLNYSKQQQQIRNQ